MNFNKSEFIRSAASEKDFPKDLTPRVIFAGRSNVGKSSAINTICQRKNFARVSSMPGKTVFVNLFKIDEKVWFVDLPGYGYAKVSQTEQERFSQLIESYMHADRPNIRRAYLIIDIRHKPTADDKTMYNWFGSYGIPVTVIANKCDKLKKSEIEPQLNMCREELRMQDDVKIIAFSAEKGTGREEIVGDILHTIK